MDQSNPLDVPTGVAVTAKKSDGSNASTASQISYFLVSGEMPNSHLYITLPLVKKYNMKLANTVVADTIENKMMITQTSNDSTSSGTAPASYTGQIGTISAVPTYNNTQGSDISSDGNYWVNYTANDEYKGKVYNSNTYQNTGYYLAGGVNKSGTAVTDGTSILYTFTFASGMDTKYSFVGWFEGSWSGDAYTVDYSKKLSGKTSFTYKPTKDTTVVAVATRDMYIGGTFTSDGDYTSTAANQTWTSGRILMQFDPTYVNPKNSSQKGRYYYVFNTVTSDQEYKFRCYDTSSSVNDSDDLSVWKTWSNNANNGSYHQSNADIAMYRKKYDTYGSHGGFIYTTKTGDLITDEQQSGDVASHKIQQNHKANGYAAPVEVYFYAYDGGISVNSTYQWSKAYVSAGRGVDVVNVDGNTTAEKYNVPTVSVASTTVGGKEVGGYNTSVAYGYENIFECTVKESNGQIQVTADPHDTNQCVQAFLVYNIDTKASEAVLVNSAEATGAITANITVPQNSKLYIVPIYKFTQAWINAQNALADETKHVETHTVYVRAEDMDKDDWGGLVAMYSWGTDSRYDSGGWPGQLMIPSDDGTSFYAPLAFTKNGLAGVTFNNYTQVYDSAFRSFLGLYQSKGVSDTQYSSYTAADYTGKKQYINQAYDYREPISIIENINEDSDNDGVSDIYDTEDMDLTFALKPGNKNNTHFGETDYSDGYSFEYLTDRSGKSRVDLNGNKLTTNATASYYVVCSYTRDYCTGDKTYDFKDGSRNGTNTKNVYSIEWTVYDNTASHTKIGSTKLSAAFTDVYKSEMMTNVAKMLDTYGFPVSGKAVKIAYEDPAEQLLNEDENQTEAKRFSGQWYADGVNSLVEGNVRVGIYSDGAWLPSDTNNPGYATATVSLKSGSVLDTSIGEKFEQEDGCSGNSKVYVTKKKATNGNIAYTVNTEKNFYGWYRMNSDGEFEPVGSNYKSLTITPSFNADITYYAFYTASASYRVKYDSREKDAQGNPKVKYFTAKGSDLTEEELADNGKLDAATRSSDIATQLAKSGDISIFNKNYSIRLTNPDTSTPYTITYTAEVTDPNYTLTVYYYDSNGDLISDPASITGAYNKTIDLTTSDIGGKDVSLIVNHPANTPVFVGWYKYDPTKSGNAKYVELLSTRANFGFSLTDDLVIAPRFVATNTERDTARGTGWNASIDRNVITKELTSANEGIFYNDSIIRFRFGPDSAQKVDLTSNPCGIVIFARTATGSNGDEMTVSSLQSYAKYMENNGKDIAKLPARYCGSGEAYMFRIKATSLSELNRVDLVHILDYAKFSGGEYMVMAYYQVEEGTSNGGNYVLSAPVSGRYTTATGTNISSGS